MKILAVAHETGISGGSNRSFLMVLRRLRDTHGVDVTVLVPDRTGPLIDCLTNLRIAWIAHPYSRCFAYRREDGLDIARAVRAQFNSARTGASARRLAERVRPAGFDLVYTNGADVKIGAAVASELGLPHVCHVREMCRSVRGYRAWDARRICSMSDRVIAISEAVRLQLTGGREDDHVVTIHNGIESSGPATFVEHEVLRSGLDVLLTGRLVPEKRQADAIRALAQVHDRGLTDTRLHLVGSRPSRTLRSARYVRGLVRLVRELGLEGSVIFHGELSSMDAVRRGKSVELVCSDAEPFGRVTVEAMRAGLVVIGARSGATPEIVCDGKNGLLYRVRDVDDLADRLQWVAENRSQAAEIARQAFSESRDVYTPEVNVGRVYEVLNDALANVSLPAMSSARG